MIIKKSSWHYKLIKFIMNGTTTEYKCTYILLVFTCILTVAPLSIISLPLLIFKHKIQDNNYLIILSIVSLLIYLMCLYIFCGFYMFFTSNIDIKAIGFFFWLNILFAGSAYLIYKLKQNNKTTNKKLFKFCKTITYEDK